MSIRAAHTVPATVWVKPRLREGTELTVINKLLSKTKVGIQNFCHQSCPFAVIAQLAERWPQDCGIVCSNPADGIQNFYFFSNFTINKLLFLKTSFNRGLTVHQIVHTMTSAAISLILRYWSFADCWPCSRDCCLCCAGLLICAHATSWITQSQRANSVQPKAEGSINSLHFRLRLTD